jgi:GT2 family glycosyltransferase
MVHPRPDPRPQERCVPVPPTAADGVRSVAAVVLDWEGGELVQRCVASVLAQTRPPEDVLVVDNGSTDGSAEAVAARFPSVRLLRLPANRGFAGGMNAGIAATSADAVLLLNQDVELEPGYLAACLAGLEAGVGGVTGRLLRPTGEIDSTGHVLYRNRRALDRGEGEPDDGRYAAPDEVFGTGGAAPLLRRAFLDDVRVAGEWFDEDFFAYYEDIDLCWRGRLRGWSFRYVPDAVARHVRGGSGRRSDRVEAGNHRNRLLLVAKDDALPSLLRHLPGIALTELRAAVHLAATRPRALLLAYAGLVRLLPRALRKRRLVQASRTVPWQDLERWMQPYDHLAVLRRRGGR